MMATTPQKSQSKQVTRPASPLESLRTEVDRLFENFARPSFGFGRDLFNFEPFKGFGSTLTVTSPKVDVAESDKAFEITAELPGMDEKDVEVTLADGILTVKGQKKEDKEDKDKNYYLVERSYGSFQRSFRLPENVNDDKVSAEVTKGILKVTLPKKAPTKKAANARKISIKSR